MPLVHELLRVLLVEDDESVVESLRRGLVRYGFTVEWVTTGTAAPAVWVRILDFTGDLIGPPTAESYGRFR